MAPEILWGIPYDSKCDIYSLGCLFFNLITGQYPYFAEEINILMKKI
jgi:serine/threonine protein kinase